MELGSRARAVARPLTHRLGRALPTPARRRVATAAMAVVALGASGMVAAYAAAPPPAHLGHTVGLQRVGPIDEANGFPLWFEDTNNVKLQLCLDPGDPYCIMGDVPNPDAAVSFPDNFPDEAFWAAAESPIDAGGGENGILVTAVEAAFGSADGLPADKQQISFGRVRVRVAGVVDGATYKVTHPFGIDEIVAEAGAVKGINVTEDVGNLVWDGVFDQTLAARTGPFLKWDPAVAPAAPPGYLGDVTVGHRVVGSPYGPDQNVFRVEGPVGSFTGSSQLCADVTLGASMTDNTDCIENYDFFVQGKIATRMGVQVTKATYRDAPGIGEKYVDIFATSEKDQNLVVSSAAISDTKMRGDDKGHYFARILVDGAIPADLKVTNTTDTPNSVDMVEVDTDTVHVLGAVYDTDAKTLTVTADSGDSGATLSLDGYGSVTPDITSGSSTVWEWVVTTDAPPATISVMSDQGGSDSDDVVITGGELGAAEVTAIITPSIEGEVSRDQAVTFDATASTGTVKAWEWSISGPGTSVTGTDPSIVFTPTQGGSYTVTLKVTGSTAANNDTATYTFTVPTGVTNPVADAGPPQEGVLPTSVVTLDGTASQFTSGYSWTGPIALTNPNSANPTFTVPVTAVDGSWTFTLTATGATGTTPSTSTVTITSNIDNVSVDAATYKRSATEWRVRGGAEHCSANNTIKVFWMNGATKTQLGTTTPALDLGVCTYDFRLKNTPSTLRPGGNGTVVVESTLGGNVTAPFQRL